MSAYFPSLPSSPSLTSIKNTLITPLGYLPSLSRMASTAATATNYVASFLPQKQSPAEIQRLIKAVADLKAPDFVEKTIAKERQALREKRLELEERYKQICGEYFEDPTSDIHNAWLSFKSEEAKIPSGKTFDPTSNTCTHPDLQKTFDAFQGFLKLEAKRQDIVAEIQLIGSAVNSDTTLKSEYTDMKRGIDTQLHSLSGDYYEDPNCQLDILWKAYRAKVDAKAPPDEVKTALTFFSLQDTLRKILEHVQFMLDKLLSSPESESTNIQKIAETKAEQQTKIFESALQDAQDNKGVDWRSLALSTLKLGTIAGTYILLDSETVI